MVKGNWVRANIGSTLFFLTLLALTGCSGSGDESASSDSSEGADEMTGVFLDSAVAGLNYQTPTRSGKTNTKGEFRYLAGENVRFSVADIVLGEAQGAVTITPLNLVPEAVSPKHPKVNNIVRFLMTLDGNRNSADGIQIANETTELAKGLSIDFDQARFDQDPGLAHLLNLLPHKPTLVNETTAHAHFSDTLTSESTWGVMIWGRGSWQDPEFLSRRSVWGEMLWGQDEWQNANAPL